MKLVLTLCFLLTVTLGLYAQSGMFGLAFEDNYSHCDSQVQQIKLSTKDQSGPVYTYRPEQESGYDSILNRLNLYMDKNSGLLSSWVGYFQYPEGIDMEAEVLASMIELHGKDYTRSSQDFYKNPNVYTWKLDATHYARIGDAGDVYYVEYYIK
jgi:hypothetical protein